MGKAASAFPGDFLEQAMWLIDNGHEEEARFGEFTRKRGCSIHRRVYFVLAITARLKKAATETIPPTLPDLHLTFPLILIG